MDKKLLVVAIAASLAACVTAAQAAPLQDARTAARGGTGIALPDLRSVTLNPASVAAAPDAGFAIDGSIGAFASDPGDAINDISDTQDDISALQDKVNSPTYVYNPNDPNQVINDLKSLSGKQIAAAAGGSLTLAIPADRVKMAFFAKNDTRVSGTFYYDPNDETYIRNAVALKYLDTSGIRSSVNVSGVAISDYGISLANTLESPLGKLNFGTSIKYQQIILADKIMRVSDYSGSDIFSTDNDTQQSGSMNVDVGAIQQLGSSPWRLAAVANNLVPHQLTVTGTGNTFHLTPQLTLGGAYDMSWFKVEADMQAFKNRGFGEIQDTQMMRLGVEVGTEKSVQVRAGIEHDLKGNQKNLFTAGFGLSPFGVVNLDLAGMVGQDRTYGVMLGLGLKI